MRVSLPNRMSSRLVYCVSPSRCVGDIRDNTQTSIATLPARLTEANPAPSPKVSERDKTSRGAGPLPGKAGANRRRGKNKEETKARDFS